MTTKPSKTTSKTVIVDPAIVEKEMHVRPKEPRKIKGIPAEPHPLDRHSGTKIHAFEYDNRNTEILINQ